MYRFCYHEKSPNIFPVGFCKSNDINLTPPNGYSASNFSWPKYLQDTGSIPAPENLFHRLVPNHGFEVNYLHNEFYFEYKIIYIF